MASYERGKWSSGSGVVKEFALDQAKARVARLEVERDRLKEERDHYQLKAAKWKAEALSSESGPVKAKAQTFEKSGIRGHDAAVLGPARKHNNDVIVKAEEKENDENAVVYPPTTPLKERDPNKQHKDNSVSVKKQPSSSAKKILSKRWNSFRRNGKERNENAEEDEEPITDFKLTRPKPFNGEAFL